MFSISWQIEISQDQSQHIEVSRHTGSWLLLSMNEIEIIQPDPALKPSQFYF